VPARERWALWAAKEAAYKLARKLDSRVVFSPRQFEVTLESAEQAARAHRGRVDHPNGAFEIRLQSEERFVHAVACPLGSDPRELLMRVERCDWAGECAGPEGPSRAVRRLACQAVGQPLGLPPDALEVRKRGRIPELHLAGTTLAGDLSISHHGAFIAFAYRAGAGAIRLGRAS
jgi:hypothetical protein